MIADIYEHLTAIGATPDGFLNAFKRASTEFAQRLQTPALVVLSACLAIRIIVGTIKEVIDGNLVDVISNVVFAGLMGVILSALILWWNVGDFSVRAFAEHTYQVMFRIAAGEDQTMGSLVASVITPASHAIEIIFRQAWELTARLTLPPAVDGWGIARLVGLVVYALTNLVNFVLLLFAWVFAAAAALSVIALMLIILFFMLAGLVAMQVGLAFGPLAVAAYPLIDVWAKKVVGVIAGGIAQATAGLLLISVVVAMVTTLGEALPIVVRMPQ